MTDSFVQIFIEDSGGAISFSATVSRSSAYPAACPDTLKSLLSYIGDSSCLSSGSASPVTTTDSTDSVGEL